MVRPRNHGWNPTGIPPRLRRVGMTCQQRGPPVVDGTEPERAKRPKNRDQTTEGPCRNSRRLRRNTYCNCSGCANMPMHDDVRSMARRRAAARQRSSSNGLPFGGMMMMSVVGGSMAPTGTPLRPLSALDTPYPLYPPWRRPSTAVHLVQAAPGPLDSSFPSTLPSPCWDGTAAPTPSPIGGCSGRWPGRPSRLTPPGKGPRPDGPPDRGHQPAARERLLYQGSAGSARAPGLPTPDDLPGRVVTLTCRPTAMMAAHNQH